MKLWLSVCLASLWCVAGSSTLFAAVLAPEDEAPSVADQRCIVPNLPKDGSVPLAAERQQQRLIKEHQGKVIRAIKFRNVNVFDESNESENNRVYRFLNRLHVHTRENVIQSQLLFEVDDALDAGTVAESERLLRTRDYLASARITLSQICADSVEVTVYVQDAWTTEPQISFGHSGGETHSGFALSEGNVLGSGNSVAIGYRKDADRSGVSYYFSSPHFLNSRLGAQIGYRDNSDGKDSLIDIAYPFYSLRTPYSFGIKAEKTTQLEPIRYQGEVVEEYRHGIEAHEIYFGKALSITSDYTHRMLLGFSKERDVFNATIDTIGSLPHDTNILYPWLEYQYIENQFGLFRNIDQIQRIEDIPMGKEFSLRLGYGDGYWGNDDEVWRYIGRYSDVLEIDAQHMLRFSAFADGTRYSDMEGINTATAGGELSYYFFSDRNNRWFARLRYDRGRDLQPHEKLAVGGTVGVRGYPLDFQRGNQRYIFSLERRHFSDIHLFNLFRIGAVAFFDAGRAWGGDEDHGVQDNSPRHLSNIGLGLRISSSKARIGHIVHIDVAMPISERQDADGVQWLIKAEQAF